MAKIMIIHHAFSIGGGSISFLDIIEMLQEEHEVIACCPGNPPDLLNYLRGKGIKAISLDLPIPTFNHYNGGHSILTRTFWLGISNYKYHKEWEVFIKSYNPDIVIVNSSVMALLGPIIKKTGSKAICFVRETFNESHLSIKTYIMKQMLNKWFEGVLFLSNYDKSFAKLTYPSTEVIADCIGKNFFRDISKKDACNQIGVCDKDFNLLYVGGLSWLKGLDVALESLKYITTENINLIIAGNMSVGDKNSFRNICNILLNPKDFYFNRRVKSILREADTAKKIKIIGIQTDMTVCYSACDAVIFPSILPHQSRPVFEAGMYSLPVIISDFDQTKEYVVNGKNGLTFKPRQADALFKSIMKLNNNPNTALELGEENSKMTLKYHNFETEKKKILHFIKEIDK